MKQLLRIHIERDRLAFEERGILEQLAKVSSAEHVKNRSNKEDRKKSDIATGKPKTDRFGNKLRVGDRVEFLTDGKFKHKNWTIYRLTEKRVLYEKKSTGQKAHREYHDVRKVA